MPRPVKTGNGARDLKEEYLDNKAVVILSGKEARKNEERKAPTTKATSIGLDPKDHPPSCSFEWEGNQFVSFLGLTTLRLKEFTTYKASLS